MVTVNLDHHHRLPVPDLPTGLSDVTTVVVVDGIAPETIPPTEVEVTVADAASIAVQAVNTVHPKDPDSTKVSFYWINFKCDEQQSIYLLQMENSNTNSNFNFLGSITFLLDPMTSYLTGPISTP